MEPRIQYASFRALFWALAFLSLALLTVQDVRASAIAVTRFDDPAPDACAPDDCSLREAIISANASPMHVLMMKAFFGQECT